MFPFENVNFDTAADWVATDISVKYQNLYVGLSGGLDSEYVVRCLQRNNIKFTPIIVKCPGSEIETDAADRICAELKIEPVIIHASSADVIRMFSEICETKINASLSILRAIAGRYVFENKGTLLTGHSFLGETGNSSAEKIGVGLFDLKDHDHLFPAMKNMPTCIGFFLYHPKIVYSMVNDIDTELSWDEYRAKLYNIPVRPKQIVRYTLRTTQIINYLTKIHTLNGIQSCSVGDLHQFHKMFDDYVIGQ
jgi:hypothetical protein